MRMSPGSRPIQPDFPARTIKPPTSSRIAPAAITSVPGFSRPLIRQPRHSAVRSCADSREGPLACQGLGTYIPRRERRGKAVSQSARAALEVTTPDGKRTILLSDHAVTLGRAEDCDVVIPEPFVSSCHAKIEPARDGYVIRDAGSTNGTWVDSAHVEGSARLEDGANLILGRPGNYRLRFISITTDEASAEAQSRPQGRKSRSGRILKG